MIFYVKNRKLSNIGIYKIFIQYVKNYRKILF